jgi:uncharacterized protein (UPF0332 family)
MAWIEIGRNNLDAAKRTKSEFPRTCASRAYYAAHVILAQNLADAGYVPPLEMQTPPHSRQVILVDNYLGYKGPNTVRELRSAMRRLYKRRLDADYNRRITVDPPTAQECLRDACTVFKLLGVEE